MHQFISTLLMDSFPARNGFKSKKIHQKILLNLRIKLLDKKFVFTFFLLLLKIRSFSLYLEVSLSVKIHFWI